MKNTYESIYKKFQKYGTPVKKLNEAADIVDLGAFRDQKKKMNQSKIGADLVEAILDYLATQMACEQLLEYTDNVQNQEAIALAGAQSAENISSLIAIKRDEWVKSGGNIKEWETNLNQVEEKLKERINPQIVESRIEEILSGLMEAGRWTSDIEDEEMEDDGSDFDDDDEW